MTNKPQPHSFFSRSTLHRLQSVLLPLRRSESIESGCPAAPPNLIRWLIILATIGLVSSVAIGLLLKRQPANAQHDTHRTHQANASAR